MDDLNPCPDREEFCTSEYEQEQEKFNKIREIAGRVRILIVYDSVFYDSINTTFTNVCLI